MKKRACAWSKSDGQVRKNGRKLKIQAITH